MVYFGLTESFPRGNSRHYRFMLEGLRETKKKLEEKGVRLIVARCEPPAGAIELAGRASLLVLDRGYLRIERRWRRLAVEEVEIPVYQVEDNVLVPVEEASDKEEYAAYTLRPKIKDQWGRFKGSTETEPMKRSSLDLGVSLTDISSAEVDTILEGMSFEDEVEAQASFRGGGDRGKERLSNFIDEKLDRFGELRNDPSRDFLSSMSPYLHFGQISPIYIVSQVEEAGGPGKDDYLEELVVRRELSMNFVHYNDSYDQYGSILPDWARETLREHRRDKRDYVYGLEEFERAETHDPYWNAAQMEMVKTGKTHGYMRMYWGKKILEWSEDPETAYETALYLNDKYELDGRDPNGFAGVAWCFGKHDRAWQEREIYGKVRYMNANGLERKFDVQSYVKRVKNLAGPYIKPPK